ncbi:MAG TPA: hypothetical protein VFB59_03120 [Candidatus Saccharimonadales bacterium]|nr:hypothetical protein [Candidatus Saccharimonadales bacterium]
MKLVILYRPNSEHASEVEAFVRDFQRQFFEAGKKIEMISIDSREGVAKSELYGIMQFPCILAVENNGALINAWVGLPLPLMNDVAGYAQAGR